MEEQVIHLKAERKNKLQKFVHVSKPSLLKQALLGKEAERLINAQGTYCKSCQLKKSAAATAVVSDNP